MVSNFQKQTNMKIRLKTISYLHIKEEAKQYSDQEYPNTLFKEQDKD